MVWRRKIIAAVGEPVGWKANWSEKDRLGGGVSNAGYMKRRTTVRSIIRVRIGVMEIGRKSACTFGAATLGTGKIDAFFHCSGTVEVDRERLKRWAIGLQNAGAPSRRNHAGSLSRPVAVGWR